MPDKDCRRCGGRGWWTTCLDGVYDCECKTPEDKDKDLAEEKAYLDGRLMQLRREIADIKRRMNELGL